MIQSEATGGIHFLAPQENHINLIPNSFPELLHFNYKQSLPFYNEFNNSSTSDEADDQQHIIFDERKQRRMISNRESARRSRMRKQRQLDELWSQVLRLRTQNTSLIDKLNHVLESHDSVLEENALLKEETSDLRRMLADLQLGGNPNNALMKNDVPCNTAHLRAESSNQYISSLSPDFLSWCG